MNILILVTIFFLVYYLFKANCKTENFENATLISAIKDYFQNDKTGDYKNYLDYIKLHGNYYNGLILHDTFYTFKTLQKMNQLTDQTISNYMKN